MTEPPEEAGSSRTFSHSITHSALPGSANGDSKLKVSIRTKDDKKHRIYRNHKVNTIFVCLANKLFEGCTYVNDNLCSMQQSSGSPQHL